MRQTTATPTASFVIRALLEAGTDQLKSAVPLPKGVKLCPTGKCQAMFANHHRLKGERLDLRLAETGIRINVSQEGGMNPWEPGQSRVSWSVPHPLLEVQKTSQTQQSCAVLSEKDPAGAVHNSFCVSSAPCTLLENFGLWFPVTLLEDQVPAPDSSKAVPLKLHLYNEVGEAHFSFLEPGLEYPKGFPRFKLLLGEILSPA